MVRQAEGSEIDQGPGMDGGMRVGPGNGALDNVRSSAGWAGRPTRCSGRERIGDRFDRHQSGPESNFRSRCPTVLTAAFWSVVNVTVLHGMYLPFTLPHFYILLTSKGR